MLFLSGDTGKLSIEVISVIFGVVSSSAKSPIDGNYIWSVFTGPGGVKASNLKLGDYTRPDSGLILICTD